MEKNRPNDNPKLDPAGVLDSSFRLRASRTPSGIAPPPRRPQPGLGGPGPRRLPLDLERLRLSALLGARAQAPGTRCPRPGEGSPRPRQPQQVTAAVSEDPGGADRPGTAPARPRRAQSDRDDCPRGSGRGAHPPALLFRGRAPRGRGGGVEGAAGDPNPGGAGSSHASPVAFCALVGVQ